MPTRYFAIAALSLFVASGAFAQGKVSDTDARALKNLAEADLAEIEAGKLAAGKAHSPQVKKFGQREKDAKETEELAGSVSDPQLKSAIRKAHAKIQEHLTMAKQIAASQSSAAGGTSRKSSK